MSGKMSRRKGAVGEREVRDILRAHGFDAYRDGRLDEDVAHDAFGYHFEVKRRETYSLDSWIKQCEDDAGVREPVVVFRKSNQPWRAVISFERLSALLAMEKACSAKE